MPEEPSNKAPDNAIKTLEMPAAGKRKYKEQLSSESATDD